MLVLDLLLNTHKFQFGKCLETTLTVNHDLRIFRIFPYVQISPKSESNVGEALSLKIKQH